MAKNDINFLAEPQFGNAGTTRHAVASGAASSIKAGEPVQKTLGSAYVFLAVENTPVVASDYFVGIAAADSTDTVAAAGYVDVYNMNPNQVYIIAPTAAATWDTQAEYDALVGDRVLLTTTAGVWTIQAIDGSTYGCVIQPLDIAKYPGKVAFSFRNGLSYEV